LSVEPGEHHVCPIKLDEWWETHPALPKTDEMPIKLKAVYEVTTTPEAAQYKVGQAISNLIATTSRCDIGDSTPIFVLLVHLGF